MSGQPPNIDDAAAWRPTLSDRVRALARSWLRMTLGHRGETSGHMAYHAALRLFGRFEPPEDAQTLDLLRLVAARSSTIIDVGANVGRYSSFFRRHASPSAHVIALEPHPRAVRLLRRTLRDQPNTTVLQVAAADADGAGSLNVPTGPFGAAIPALSWVSTGSDSGGTAIEVPLRRLDTLAAAGSIRISPPVFVKIDVEGFEEQVLRGGRDLIGRLRPIIYFECQEPSVARAGGSVTDVWALLETAGYGIFVSLATGLARASGPTPEHVNYWAFPDSRELPETLDDDAVRRMLEAFSTA